MHLSLTATLVASTMTALVPIPGSPTPKPIALTAAVARKAELYLRCRELPEASISACYDYVFSLADVANDPNNEIGARFEGWGYSGTETFPALVPDSRQNGAVLYRAIRRAMPMAVYLACPALSIPVHGDLKDQNQALEDKVTKEDYEAQIATLFQNRHEIVDIDWDAYLADDCVLTMTAELCGKCLDEERRERCEELVKIENNNPAPFPVMPMLRVRSDDDLPGMDTLNDLVVADSPWEEDTMGAEVDK